MIVVDVNVVAYFLIEGEHTGQARELWRCDPDWRLPLLWQHEYLNVLATFVRHGGADIADALMLWRRAVNLLADAEVEVDMEGALGLAARENISAYDAQYIVLAQQLCTVCVTEDKRLLKVFPGTARTMEQVCSIS